MSKKITLVPVKSEEDICFEESPKVIFMRWCWAHGRELTDMVQNCDFDMFDGMWPYIAEIFKLSLDGKHGTCETCLYHSPEEHYMDDECWTCKGSMDDYYPAR